MPEEPTEKATFRVSVRELVEFTYFPEDIMPSGGLAQLWSGTRAHQERQRMQEGETERPVQRTFHLMGESITVHGRMDAFTVADVPLIEEMKLSEHGASMQSVIPAHRAQAAVYAAMVALEYEVKEVRFAVTYVNEGGVILKAFEEQLGRDALLAELNALLMSYMAFAIAEKQHREKRDASLALLPFPFETYREGQREMAAQVYTAIVRKRRLFASLPTGTGKSAAILFPALKAMGQGKTGKLLYLTARTTARQSPLNALELMLAQGLHARAMTLTAKEKLCPAFTRCHPNDCPRARGHFLRQGEAIAEILKIQSIWTDETISQIAEKHRVCPFEFALALTELADVVLMDMNYAFDPFAQLKRLFQFRRDLTILADEAHHIVDRVRENLSGQLDSGMLREVRVRFGKVAGRKHPYYAALSRTIAALRAVNLEREACLEGKDGFPARDDENLAENAPKEGLLKALPEEVTAAAEALCEATMALLANPLSDAEVMGEASSVLYLCAPFLYAAERLDEDYAVLMTAHGKERRVELYCLFPAKEIARVTKRMCGTVFFSATMAPLSATKQMLGGEEEDACFALPSPFPPENLVVLRRRIATRYRVREQSAEAVAESIAEAARSRKGKYIAYFPSYAYLRMVREYLERMETPPLYVQQSDMDEAARQAFLEAFTQDAQPKLGLCVLGSLFSEGIDLPGEQLIGVMIVGVGLPVPSLRQRSVQACYAQHFGDGFAYACRIPGMQKVLQAAGRVIRSETDRGMILLLDERYFEAAYAGLLPESWRFWGGSIQDAVKSLEEGNA